MKTCDKCGSSFFIVIADGRDRRTTNDGILRMEVTWRCPVCSHDNSEVGIFPYEPIKMAEGLSIPSECHITFAKSDVVTLPRPENVSCDCGFCAGTNNTLEPSQG